ncbi:hypothetical protein [Micromonospora carbonacea]|uniref:Uncharacterized protein n=1 Tax=Micromonospora carbonacea TaxID=47853 RepID=A0A7H8XKU0_9ACTN|nr:hypothetical protein [Micromonospora carbonacea]MBB5827795.1 hypothetical protein [Micromonospora carbonacea]QLD24492.1 hypothetical protein HXZ27_10010 [Micromonospora carbonacea]
MALLSGSDRRVEAEIPGDVYARFARSDEQFVNAAKVTHFLPISALQVFKRRHLEPVR